MKRSEGFPSFTERLYKHKSHNDCPNGTVMLTAEQKIVLDNIKKCKHNRFSKCLLTNEPCPCIRLRKITCDQYKQQLKPILRCFCLFIMIGLAETLPVAFIPKENRGTTMQGFMLCTVMTAVGYQLRTAGVFAWNVQSSWHCKSSFLCICGSVKGLESYLQCRLESDHLQCKISYTSAINRKEATKHE